MDGNNHKSLFMRSPQSVKHFWVVCANIKCGASCPMTFLWSKYINNFYFNLGIFRKFYFEFCGPNEKPSKINYTEIRPNRINYFFNLWFFFGGAHSVIAITLNKFSSYHCAGSQIDSSPGTFAITTFKYAA